MNSKLLLKRLEKSLDDIRSITRVFEHTAARKMDVNRKEIDRVTRYLTEAQESYSYAKIAASLGKKNAQQILMSSFRSPKRGKVLILVSSESKYWGNLIKSLARQFVFEMRQSNADGIVVGEVGKKLLAEEGFNPPNLTFFDFSDDKPDWTVVARVSQALGDYREIVIFYGKYKSVLTQEIEREDISKSIVVSNVPKVKKYDFEHTEMASLDFLERTIVASKFLEKLYQTGLTKNAVAVKILEIGAIAERINAAYSQLGKFKMRLSKDTNNRKQNQLFAARDLWQTGGIFTVRR